MFYFWIFLGCISYSMGFFAAAGNVILIAKNVTSSFEDIEANFAPSVRGPGICGTASIAEPLDACSLLTNGILSSMNGTRNPFVLIIRGGCSFEHKVRRAQAAGFEAAIVYDNETSDLVAMAGNPVGIDINAVFVSKVAGETLVKYAGAADMQLWIVPSYENPTRSIIALSTVSLIGMSALLAAYCIFRRHRVTTVRPLGPRVREFHGISHRLVKAMPSLIFTAVLEDNCTSQTCAICLEDYNVGEKLRVLPCRHKFHAVCVDTWLTSWRTFCPVCKRDAKTITMNPPPTESTPLLTSAADSVSSSSSSSLPPPSHESSPALVIVPSSYQSRSVSKPQPISNILCDHLSLQPRNQSPQLTTNQSSIGHSNWSALQPDGACVFSSSSSSYTSLSSLNSIYVMPYATSPGNASPTYIGSSSHQPNYTS